MNIYTEKINLGIKSKLEGTQKNTPILLRETEFEERDAKTD